MKSKLIAIILGIINHAVFICAIYLMAKQLFYGLTLEPFFNSAHPDLINLLLIIQFPLLHSWLLSQKGRAVLANIFPGDLGKLLSTTSYTTIGSIQLVLTFGLWQPTNLIIWKAQYLEVPLTLFYGLSWALLGWAMYSADLRIQTGALGWMAMARGRKPIYPKDFPTTGLFSICRQPIYLSFALILWSSPYLTLDKLILSTCWTAYCFYGPRFKEIRFKERWGDRFVRYQKIVPYFLPKLSLPNGSSSAEPIQP